MIGFGIEWLDWIIWGVGFFTLLAQAAIILWLWGQHD